MNSGIFRDNYWPLKIILKAHHSFKLKRKYCKATVRTAEAAQIFSTVLTNSNIKRRGIRIIFHPDF